MLVQKSREILYFKLPVVLFDLAVLIGVEALLVRVMPLPYVLGFPLDNFWGTLLLLVLSYFISLGALKLTLSERMVKPIFVVWRTVLRTVLTFIVYIVFIAVVFKSIPRYLVGYQALLSLPILALGHFLVLLGVRALRNSGFNTRHVVIVGDSDPAFALVREFENGQSVTGYKVLARFGDIDSFLDWLGRDGNWPDELYCTLPPSDNKEGVDKLIKVCNDCFIDFSFVPAMEGYPKRDLKFDKMGRIPVIKLREEPMDTLFCVIVKRGFDIVFSTLLLCTLFPLACLFVFLGNHLTGDKGPLFFKQKRTGYSGREFVLYKFRSMQSSPDADTVQATFNDSRKTRFGAFLRRSSVDELPQLLNVFVGDMSFIGPRPHMVYHTEVYSKLIGDYMVRHLCKPGLTGWAQVNGLRGETRDDTQMRSRVEYDIWYIENWSVLLDIEIFFKTLVLLIPGRDKQAY